MFGWMEVRALRMVGPFVALAWFANPLLLMTWVLGTFANRRARNAAVVAGALACSLCVGYVVFGRIAVDGSGIPRNAVHWTTGYGLWLTAIMTALCRAFIRAKPRNRAAGNCLPPGSSAAGR